MLSSNSPAANTPASLTQNADDLADLGLNSDTAADYENTEVAQALARLQLQGDYPALADFLTALRHGYLVVDVTGWQGKKQRKRPRVRTLRTARGQAVLPIFTSMQQLRQAVTAAAPKGAIMPAARALELIRTGPFVAAEFNPGTAKQIVLRKFIELVLSDAEITAGMLSSKPDPQ